ncbi:uncharacterized protein LAESUDRAFT_517889 [Laetiporus sulphureus 93-53]|uniref:Uncharacterized protein n=1 Tax=Laetiporus sulphureus 93-53 TaxID=1314785 RepID=A0A165G1V8_9APHY|nr:uncharacterized protein LAESUDRAFT_517889 [Laetiporus sulphureus 93-53]KZT09716.1 hypothetical protein LAESUDRAFT_517889 [Laetiporus sulphureus 93-53]
MEGDARRDRVTIRVLIDTADEQFPRGAGSWMSGQQRLLILTFGSSTLQTTWVQPLCVSSGPCPCPRDLTSLLCVLVLCMSNALQDTAGDTIEVILVFTLWRTNHLFEVIGAGVSALCQATINANGPHCNRPLNGRWKADPEWPILSEEGLISSLETHRCSLRPESPWSCCQADLISRPS